MRNILFAMSQCLLLVALTGCGPAVRNETPSAKAANESSSNSYLGSSSTTPAVAIPTPTTATPPPVATPSPLATPVPTPTPAPVSGNSAVLNIPPRIQWMSNYGYCGEMSMISVGLYYGQYISQFDARTIASPGVSQTSANSQLLLGVNAGNAAKAMKLKATEWNAAGTANQFLTWVKQNIARTFPVIIGVFMRTGTDPDYDHIVPVFAVKSSQPMTDLNYYSDDVLTFNDLGVDKGTTFSYAFGAFQGKSNVNPYSLKTKGNYGISITGVMDTNGDTLPVRIDTNLNDEAPEIKGGTRPTASPLTLMVTVSGLQAGLAYKLYKYTSFANVPTSAFNTNAAKAAKIIDVQIAAGSVFKMTETIQSNEMAIYRAVRASAP